LIPDSNKIPKVVFPLLYTWTAYYLVQYYQASYISSHINAGGQIYNWWRTIAVALIGLAVTFISIVVTVYFSDEITNPETVSIYGAAENEIHFNNNNISYIEIGKLGEAFEEIDFFSDENKKFVYVKKIKNDYEISISCNKKVINNPDIIEAFSKMRIEMQKRFPKNKLIFNLVVDRLDNIIKRIK
jgi:hypothetical protein